MMAFFLKLNFKFVYALPQGDQLSHTKFCQYDETQHFTESLQGESTRGCSMNHFIIARVSCDINSTIQVYARKGFHSPQCYKTFTQVMSLDQTFSSCFLKPGCSVRK